MLRSYDLLVDPQEAGDSVAPVEGGGYLWRLVGELGGATARLAA